MSPFNSSRQRPSWRAIRTSAQSPASILGRFRKGFAAGVLGNIEAICGEKRIHFVGVQREGLPSQILTEECRSGDLLFIGQKGENARFARTIVGSTAEDVARSSPRPVMACPDVFRAPEKILFPYDGSPAAERALLRRLP